MTEIKLNKLLFDVSEDDYHNGPGLSRSYFKKLAVSPAEARLPEDDTASTNLGKAFHILTLEGMDRFDQLVFEAPTKTAGVKFQELAAANPGNVVIALDGRQKILEAYDGMMLHPMVQEIYKHKIDTEVTGYWRDEETGLLLKFRADQVIKDMNAIADIKFVQKGGASERKFRYMIRDYGYDLQSAMYTEGAAKCTGQVFEHFLFIVVENEPPYYTAVFEMDRDWMGDQLYELHRLYRLEKQCQEANHWPNYNPDEPGIQTLVAYY